MTTIAGVYNKRELELLQCRGASGVRRQRGVRESKLFSGRQGTKAAPKLLNSLILLSKTQLKVEKLNGSQLVAYTLRAPTKNLKHDDEAQRSTERRAHEQQPGEREREKERSCNRQQ